MGEDGIFADAPSRHPLHRLLLDPPRCRRARCGARASRRASGCVDAPVSGGDVGAIDATLSIMVGGERGRRRPTPCRSWSRSARPSCTSGPAGAGQTVKAANQLIVAGTIELVAEAIVFLEAYGVDMEAAIKVLAGGLAGNRSWTARQPTCSARVPARVPDRPAPQGHGHRHRRPPARPAWPSRSARSTAQLVGALRAPRATVAWTTPPCCARRAAVRPQPSPPPIDNRRDCTWPRMRAVDAAVLILEKEGATQAFGLPGAAINPFYAAMRKHGSIKHVLARHVEGASHMAEGYTRAKAGNIGVCIGTSRPGRHRHDHRPVLGLGRLDPDPVHHRPGAGRPAAQGGLPGGRHRLHRHSRSPRWP